ncbi:MAG: choice-of-anchor J domain-containing protein, partial [Bacteroidales bacterium]
VLVFNPDKTDPCMPDNSSFRPDANGGKRIGVFMSVNYKAASDWLISPRMNVTSENPRFEMLAREVRSIDSDISEHYIEIATTEDVPSPADFKKLTPEVCHVTTSWQKYSYSLQEYIGQKIWVALHHVSKMKYALLVDNLSLPGCEPVLNQEVGMPDSQNEGNISISPNPFEDQLIVRASAPIREVRIYNLQGILVRACEVDNMNEFILDASGLTSGVYQISVSTTVNKEIKRLMKR